MNADENPLAREAWVRASRHSHKHRSFKRVLHAGGPWGHSASRFQCYGVKGERQECAVEVTRIFWEWPALRASFRRLQIRGRWLFFHPSLQHLGLSFFALLEKKDHQVLAASSRSWMLHTKCFLGNRERPPVKRFGVLIFPLIVHEQRQIVQIYGSTRV